MSTETMKSPKVRKSDAEWRRQLTREQYRITRRNGTERPFSGPHRERRERGLYLCVCCDRPLFSAEAKYESGTGWPSFTQPVDAHAVDEHREGFWLFARTEVRCSDCDAHLGHVFGDGPRPTGLRYCMNGHALRLDEPH